MDNKKLSVEWLESRIKVLIPEDIGSQLMFKNNVAKAKEMEKKKIIDAFDEGQEYEYQYHINNAPKFYSETYFAETYESKGSDNSQNTKQ